MLAPLELLHVDQLAAGRVDFFHLLNLCFEFFLHAAHHLTLLFQLLLLLEVLLEVVRDRHGVAHIAALHEGTEHFLFANYALAESVELRGAVGDLLVRGLGLVHEVLAIRQVATDLFADHHRQLVNRQLSRRSVVSPVVVVRPTDRVQLVRMLLLDGLRAHLLS